MWILSKTALSLAVQTKLTRAQGKEARIHKQHRNKFLMDVENKGKMMVQGKTLSGVCNKR